MDTLYPKGPESISTDLMQASPTYKKRAWLAFASLILFIVLYFSLTAWFVWKSYTLFNQAASGGSGSLAGYGFAVAAAFLALFLVRALFFVKHGGEINDLEVNKDQEPKLFDFLYLLADEAGAPRPHRVFISNRVNAAVFYNLTLLNLIFPSKKNLEIGLPLVNSLTLGELKAVLAHEFGHFRQGSMAIGRWIYIAQQIATHIIQERSVLDKFLNGLSRIDIRIAWIGWILRLIVWSLRAILDTVFSLVILAERSLSREMEFHADLVSVSLTGSDALIHALHRLHAADETWERALTIASSELNKGKAVEDIFVIQKMVSMQIKKVLDDETYDEPPPLPNSNLEKHRIFKAETAHPPRMWSTHPPNHAREDNAKRSYVSAPLDNRSPWELFSDGKSLRETMTANILGAHEESEEIKKCDTKDAVAEIKKQYDKRMFDRRYHGTYLGRSIARNFANINDMYMSLDNQNLEATFSQLYPESFADQLEQWRNLIEEKNILKAIYDGNLKTPDGIIRHRGEIMKRRDLPDAIESLAEECTQIQKAISEKDSLIRSTNLSAAKALGQGWDAYLTSLLALHHYADHSAANLRDVEGYLSNVWAVITADGHISNQEVKRLLACTEDVYQTMYLLDEQKSEVRLCSNLKEALKINEWTEILNEDFNLTAPSKENINEWINVISGWLNYFSTAFETLKHHSLEVLLASEAHIEKCFLEKSDPGKAPTPGTAPKEYTVLLPDSERELQTRLGWWDRFQIADGFAASAARFLVSVTIVGSVLGFGMIADSANITIYNGLATTVTVNADTSSVQVTPFNTAELTPSSSDTLLITTTAQNGDIIEQFNINASNSLADYIYNVANAAPLIEWTEIYGNAPEKPARYLGSPRWLTSNADIFFGEPPASVQTSGEGTTRDILSGFGGISPYQLENYLLDKNSPEETIRAHATWDDAQSKELLNWLARAIQLPDFAKILEKRLTRNSNEVMSLRLKQDTTNSIEEKNAVCENHISKAQAEPDNMDWQYLAARCENDGPTQTRRFIQGYQNNPQHAWFALAAGYSYAQASQWDNAMKALTIAFAKIPPMQEVITDPIVRIHRITGSYDQERLANLLQSSSHINDIAQLESNTDTTDDSLKAYLQLSNGELEQALTSASKYENAPYILRLVAASDGASKQAINKAKKLDPDQGINGSTIWTAMAFMQRHRMDYKPLLGLLNPQAGGQTSIMVEFLEGLKKPTNRKQLNLLLNQLNPDMRGHAYAMGLIILGQKAPSQWREDVKKLLFAAERPFFY